MRRLNPVIYIRALYEWTLKWADHPRSVWALGALSTVEGIFFPIPVDPFLIAMGASRPKKALKFAMIAALTSVIGGCIGYSLGFWFWETAQGFFHQYVFSAKQLKVVTDQFNDNAFVAIFLASFTPIPYKVFAISAGIAKISISTFIFASIVGRSLRFLVIGALLYKWGPSIKENIEKYFNQLTYALGVACVLGYLVYKFM